MEVNFENMSVEERITTARTIVEEYNRLKFEENLRNQSVTWKETRPKKKRSYMNGKLDQIRREREAEAKRIYRDRIANQRVIKGHIDMPDNARLGSGYISVIEDREIFAEDLSWYESSYDAHDTREGSDDSVVYSIVKSIYNRL